MRCSLLHDSCDVTLQNQGIRVTVYVLKYDSLVFIFITCSNTRDCVVKLH